MFLTTLRNLYYEYFHFLRLYTSSYDISEALAFTPLWFMAAGMAYHFGRSWNIFNTNESSLIDHISTSIILEFRFEMPEFHIKTCC